MNDEARTVDNTATQLERSCRSIAKKLEAIVNGSSVRDSNGDILNRAEIDTFLSDLEPEEREGFEEYCAEQAYEQDDLSDEEAVDVMVDVFDAERVDIGDYFEDALDVMYTCNAQKEFIGVRVAVAIGGSYIYIDTDRSAVLGYWGSDRAEFYFERDVRVAINGYFKNIFDCLS